MTKTFAMAVSLALIVTLAVSPVWAVGDKGACFNKVGYYSHKITSLDKPHKLVYYNPGLE